MCRTWLWTPPIPSINSNTSICTPRGDDSTLYHAFLGSLIAKVFSPGKQEGSRTPPLGLPNSISNNAISTALPLFRISPLSDLTFLPVFHHCFHLFFNYLSSSSSVTLNGFNRSFRLSVMRISLLSLFPSLRISRMSHSLVPRLPSFSLLTASIALCSIFSSLAVLYGISFPLVCLQECLSLAPIDSCPPQSLRLQAVQ